MLTGDAISPGSIKAVYQANYRGLLELDRFPVTMFPGREVVAGEPGPDGSVVLHATGAEGEERHQVRYAVLATGRRPAPVPFDRDLLDRVEIDESADMIVDSDYSVRWKGANGHRMYALNRARLSHGIADANLTLLPIRSAVVLNSMFERELFAVTDDLLPVAWG